MRNRLFYFFIVAVIVILGLSSRRYSYALPGFIAEYAGDTLWAMMVFFIFRIIFISLSTFRIAVMALVFSYLIEISQLYQADWINSLRGTRLGGLVLGYGFLWSDIVCYSVGVLIGAV